MPTYPELEDDRPLNKLICDRYKLPSIPMIIPAKSTINCPTNLRILFELMTSSVASSFCNNLKLPWLIDFIMRAYHQTLLIPFLPLLTGATRQKTFLVDQAALPVSPKRRFLLITPFSAAYCVRLSLVGLGLGFFCCLAFLSLNAFLSYLVEIYMRGMHGTAVFAVDASPLVLLSI